MEDVAASEQSIPQGVLELIERNSDCVLRRMVSSFGVVGLVPSLENTKNKDLTPETQKLLRRATRGKMRLELEINELRIKHRSMNIDEIRPCTS